MTSDQTPATAAAASRSTTSTRIRLTGPASVVAAVPHLLGFAPARSAVLIFLSDQAREIKLTVRVDLPTSADEEASWVQALVSTGRHAAAHQVIAVVVDDIAEATAPDLPWQHVVEAIGHELEQHDLALTDALLIGRDRWWSYLCENPQCCPPDGTPVEASEAWRVRAAFAYEGVAALPSRDAVADRLRAFDDEWTRDVWEGVELAAPYAGDFDADEVFDVLTLSTGHDSALRHDSELAARALVGLRSIPVRDSVIVGLVARIEERGVRSVAQILDGLCFLVRVAPPEYVPPVASVVAVLSWQCGDGALASCALDRALGEDPEYSLALLVDALVRNGVPPQAVRSGLANLEVPHPRAS